MVECGPSAHRSPIGSGGHAWRFCGLCFCLLEDDSWCKWYSSRSRDDVCWIAWEHGRLSEPGRGIRNVRYECGIWNEYRWETQGFHRTAAKS